MKKLERLTIRVSPEWRAALRKLAEFERRSESDTIRLAIEREAKRRKIKTKR